MLPTDPAATDPTAATAPADGPGSSGPAPSRPAPSRPAPSRPAPSRPAPSRPAPSRPRHRYRCPLRWGDLDAQGHVNNAAYLDYLQEARVDFLLAGPPALADLLTTGVLVVSHQVEYLRPVGFGPRPLEVDLWVEAVGGSRFVIGYDVLDGDVLAARARTGAVPFDLAAGALRRLRPEERSALVGALDPVGPLSPLGTSRPGPAAHRHPLSVRWSDLDSYGHVNNVKYFDYVQEARIALIAETAGWSGDDVWVIARQDLDYLRPMDFRTAPYEVASVVTDVGTRSFRLAVDITDPVTRTVFATARTVVVGPAPLSDRTRAALQRWRG